MLGDIRVPAKGRGFFAMSEGKEDDRLFLSEDSEIFEIDLASLEAVRGTQGFSVAPGALAPIPHTTYGPSAGPEAFHGLWVRRWCIDHGLLGALGRLNMSNHALSG